MASSISGDSGPHFIYERGISFVGAVLTFLRSSMQKLIGTAEPTGGKIAANDTPTSITAAAKKRPPLESPESVQTRSLVISSFWAIVIILGLPMWWWTTSIHRARLPLQEMLEWADGKVSNVIGPLTVA